MGKAWTTKGPPFQKIILGFGGSPSYFSSKELPECTWDSEFPSRNVYRAPTLLFIRFKVQEPTVLLMLMAHCSLIVVILSWKTEVVPSEPVKVLQFLESPPDSLTQENNTDMRPGAAAAAARLESNTREDGSNTREDGSNTPTVLKHKGRSRLDH